MRRLLQTSKLPAPSAEEINKALKRGKAYCCDRKEGEFNVVGCNRGPFSRTLIDDGTGDNYSVTCSVHRFRARADIENASHTLSTRSTNGAALTPVEQRTAANAGEAGRQFVREKEGQSLYVHLQKELDCGRQSRAWKSYGKPYKTNTFCIVPGYHAVPLLLTPQRT